MNLNKISDTTKALWRGVAKTLSDAETLFTGAYKQSLDDMVPDWRTRYHEWDGFARVVSDIDAALREFVCGELGMSAPTYNRYSRAARASLLAGVKFNLATRISTGKLVDAVKMADKDTEPGDREEKINRAVDKLVKHRDNKSKVQSVAKTATVIVDPTEGDTPAEYLTTVVNKIKAHFEREKVVALVGSDPSIKLLLQAIGQAAYTPKQEAA